MDTVWITGAAGFTGGHLIAHLHRQKDRPRMVGLDMAGTAPAGLDAYYPVDLLRLSDLRDLATDEVPRWVIHLAGAVPPAEAETMWEVNVLGTLNLLRALAGKAAASIRFVTVGSAAEYHVNTSGALKETDPCGGQSAYGQSKWAQTCLSLAVGRELGLSVAVARPFNLIGPGLSSQLVAGWLCRQYASSDAPESITIGNLESARDFVDVRDAVKAYWLLTQHEESQGVYNVCTSKPVSVRELLTILAEISGRSPEIRVDPTRFRATDPPAVYGSWDKLREATGWTPSISLRDSLADMLEGAVRDQST